MPDPLEAFLGTWQLDPTTLAYEYGRPGLRAAYTIARTVEGLAFTLDADDADGKPMHVVYGGKLDGQDHPIPGYPVTLALALLKDGSIESVAKKDGTVVDRWTRTITGDPTAMLIRQHGANPDGKPFINSGIYRRVG